MEKENTFFKDYQSLINSFEALKKEKENPFFKSKYVTLNQILPVVKAKCTEHNFILMQFPMVREVDEGSKNTLATHILHKDGKEIKGEIEIISKDPNDPQKVGAGITYMRRYSLITMFGLEDEDDDGNLASNTKPATIQQVKETFATPPQAGPQAPTPIPQGQKCQKCGADMKLSKAGSMYCAELCWKK